MEKIITMAHGSGGRQTSDLIKKVFAKYFANEFLTEDDAAILPKLNHDLAMTTDGFVVSPWNFFGGNIGKLSICGTVNDLVCMGAIPKFLSCAFVIEEGFAIDDLEKIAMAMKETAEKSEIKIVAGDTKVVGKGQVDKIFITTTGVGERIPSVKTGGALADDGDAVIVSGDIGRHGCSILLARDTFGISADVLSDCAPLWSMMKKIFMDEELGKAVHVVRDATRGGVGTVLYEIASQSQCSIKLDAEKIPVSDSVQGVCEMLGLEPLYLACEGRMVLIVEKNAAEKVVQVLRENPNGENAQIIGFIQKENAGRVFVKTEIGTETILPEPTGELLPRIC